MTPAGRALRAGLRRCFPDTHFRYQGPLGPYYPDIACHRAKLIVEVDGSQHAGAAEYDAERTAYLENRGYKVLRFWNNQVLQELESVLTTIAAHLPSPLAGEGGAKRRMGGARQSRARANGAHPLPNPPRKGEGFHGQSPIGVR
jgi:very-short-patch-repair endonuclease